MSFLLTHAFFWAPVAIVTAVAMEPWAASLHDRLWHRMLWPIHRTHHAPRRGALEANDMLAAIHAPVAIALIVYGCLLPGKLAGQVAFGLGVGMTVFAVAYVIIHDGVVHGRLPVRRLLASAYVRKVVRAHRAHHRNELDGHPFGLFLGPWELERARRRTTQRDREGSP
jgi:beta-carotene 3-hydroxylase